MRALILLLLLIAPSFAARRCESCARDSRGRIQRSPSVIRQFKKLHPCPTTGRSTGACPAWRIDHVRALCDGGKNELSNLQWQSVADAKAKDKLECRQSTQ